jgi:hypothetical protein
MTAHLIGVTGIPGTGKSHFARSARALGKTAVALTDPKEASFYGTDGVTLFADLDWRPHINQFNADGLTRLFAWLDARYKDDSQFVVLDTASEASDLAMHEVLKVHATNDPGDVGHGRAYTGHDQQIKALVTELRRIASKGKTVVCVFHAQMRELEGAGAAARRPSFGDKNKQEWQFDDQMLPVMCSAIRQRIHSAFDIWLYTSPLGFGPARKWYVTAQADSVRPAKHSVTFKPGVNIAQIENTMQALFNSLDEPPRAAETPK